MTDFSNLEAIARVYDVLDKLGVMKTIESKLNKIVQEEKLDNTTFFEGNDDSDFEPKIVIAAREIPLDKLKYKL
jgi:hypothetical protein